MRDMNKQLLKEQNIQELIVAAKIISSYFLGPSIEAPVPEFFTELSHEGLFLDLTKGARH